VDLLTYFTTHVVIIYHFSVHHLDCIIMNFSSIFKPTNVLFIKLLLSETVQGKLTMIACFDILHISVVSNVTQRVLRFFVHQRSVHT